MISSLPFGAVSMALTIIVAALLLAIALLVWFYQNEKRSARRREVHLRRAMLELKKKQKEAQQSKNELMNTKLALMNMVEDLTESYEKLKGLDNLKSDFVANVSHELRTPITTITLSFDLLQKEKNPKKRKELLSMVRRNVLRLNKTVDSILDFSAVEAGAITLSTERLKLRGLVLEVVQEEAPKAEAKGIQLSTSVPHSLEVKVDRELAHRALLNIVDNAIKFTDKGHVKISAKQQKDYIIVSVKDSGRGIRKKDLPKIFGKFAKLEKHVPGSGIGLWVSKKIIENHGGKIEVKSERKRGTEVVIAFPVAVKK